MTITIKELEVGKIATLVSRKYQHVSFVKVTKVGRKYFEGHPAHLLEKGKIGGSYPVTTYSQEGKDFAIYNYTNRHDSTSYDLYRGIRMDLRDSERDYDKRKREWDEAHNKAFYNAKSEARAFRDNLMTEWTRKNPEPKAPKAIRRV